MYIVIRPVGCLPVKCQHQQCIRVYYFTLSWTVFQFFKVWSDPSTFFALLHSLIRSECMFVCTWCDVRVLEFTYLSFRPPSPPQCGLSDGPTRCCTWSKSAWQALLCSRDWQVYSSQCSLPRVQTGSEVRAPEGRRGRFPGVRLDSGNHHHLSLWKEEKRRLILRVTAIQ